VDTAGAMRAHRQGQMRRFRRGRRAGQEHNWGSPGTQEVPPFPLTKSRPEIPGDQLHEILARLRSAARGQNNERLSGIDRTKETKLGETYGGKS